MRLTAIKLAGFKSFVDVTTLSLPSNLTAVVGPNGSGKSNLIDAVRWVLGESNARQLRGSDSEDVIFNGSNQRKPGGRASVELRFDNSDNSLRGTYANYGEISVRREVVRGAGSQYFINGQKCLKREVVDLFLGTGLGTRSQYAILEQGTIARLVDAKPEEMRLLLEEAAGISRYKERRRETESRIRQTRGNLDRLADLEAEIEQRLKVLTRQAADAEKYRELKQRERQLKVEVLLLRQRDLEAHGEAQRNRIRELEARQQTAQEKLREAERQREQLAAVQQSSSEALNERQGKVYQAEASLAREQQALEHARELQALHQRELQELDTRIDETRQRHKREQQRRADVLHALQAARSRAEADTAKEQQLSELATRAEQDFADQQTRWDEFNQRAQAPMLEAEGERARLRELERTVEQTEQRLHRMQQERSLLDQAPLQEALKEADDALRGLDETMTASRAALQSADEQLQALREQRAGVESALHEARRALQDARGRESSLETLQQAALRQDDGELDQWLRQREWHQRPQLAASIRVEAGWEAAVEHVLEGLLQAPLLAQWKAADAPATGPGGGAVLASEALQITTTRPDSLAACVEGPAVVNEWLDGIHRADDAATATSLLERLPPGESVITADGVWRGHGWVRYPRSGEANSGVIARGQLLRELQTQARLRERQVDEFEQQLDQLKQQGQTLEAAHRNASSRYEQARNEHAKRLAERRAQGVRLEQMQTRIKTLDEELQGLTEQHQQAVGERSTARERLVELERVAESLRAERATLQQSLSKAREQNEQTRAELREAMQARSRAQVELAAQSSALPAVDQSLAEIATQLEQLDQQRRKDGDGNTDLAQPVSDHGAGVERARAVLNEARELLRRAREQLTADEQRSLAAQQAQRLAEEQRDTARERLQQVRLEFENHRARCEALQGQLAETGEDVTAVAATLDSAATVEGQEEQLARTARRIERLGAINLAAIPELKESRERADYLEAQHRDLDDALETLETAMRKLDRETRDLFRNTFERVDVMFRERCPQLFGGGDAHLELVGDDWLSSGVRVMARPPGKRNTTIQLLSGGEKAMVALALLFVLFELNPAPFCLLDEVEAPLDDANVVRFSDMVREMSKRVQFIIISHNKITMELAESLHGVTMQEPGVSRLVSVDMIQATSMIEPPAETAEA